MCDGPSLSDEGIVGNCTAFRSSTSTPIEEQKWTYIAFTYDTYNKKGTFVVDQIFGYDDDSIGASFLYKFFYYDSKTWQKIYPVRMR